MINAVVIVSYNDSKRIKALVEKLISFSYFDYIVISDNNSNQEELDLLNGLKAFGNVEIIQNGGNIGFSGANNSALEWLKDKAVNYVFTVNSDVDFEKSLALTCVEFLQSHEDIAVVSANMIENGEKKQNFYNFPTVSHAVAENLGFIKLFGIKPKIAERYENYDIVDYIRSSFWVVRYSDFANVGFFDLNTFLYHVETCVGIKLFRNNKKCAVLKELSYLHNHVYKDGYKMRGYKDSYKSLKYIFKSYYRKNKFQMFCLACSYKFGYVLRKICGVK